ncbi:hypothetical protein WKU33_14620 [Oceanobacillus sp. HCA-5259]|uniref:hypothetical protein n=1 Tax=Oceanobacillus sp. HCA-5259 TaxID=3134661 RepID=UPI0030C29CA0
MKLSSLIPTLLGLVSLFFISLGLWFGSTYNYAPFLGFVLGIIFFLLAGQVSGKLKKREEKRNEEEKRNGGLSCRIIMN